VEEERQADGSLVAGVTVLVVNRECPWRCLMCDLWKQTTTRPVAPGDVPAQIEFAMGSLPSSARGWIKLYNAGSFFDAGAISPGDHGRIAKLCDGFDRVIVESHPRLVGPVVWRFQDRLRKPLEVAMGLETANPRVLSRLNKRMNTCDFEEAALALRRKGIGVRAFLLLQPPFLEAAKGEEWACRSIDFAQGAGCDPVVVIPTRIGNGAMERLRESGDFVLPTLGALERVVRYGVNRGRGRVFADLWDLHRFVEADANLESVRSRLVELNQLQSG
jgi:radical SAM enzyme (TIGR01210 family)